MPAANGGVVRWIDLEPQLLGIGERLARLESKHETDASSLQARRNRMWVVLLTLLTGLVCPVIVTALIAFLHLHTGP